MTRRHILDAATSFVAAAFCIATAFAIGATAKAESVSDLDPENTLIIEVGLFYEVDDASATPPQTGKVVVKLLPDVAPGHVTRVKELAREGFYDGVPFHRVIEGFMAQTGDPTGTGMGGSEKPDLKAEFSNANHGRGTCSMARAQNPDSANSQFFICFDDASFLNRQYSVWGQVIEGMDAVDQIKRGEPVQDPDKIVTMRVAADL